VLLVSPLLSDGAIDHACKWFVAPLLQTELPAMPVNVAKPISSDDEIDLIWGAKAIGAVLNLNERQAFFQLEAGRIPGARKWGRKWSASGAVLREAPPSDG
jgi:hypothetical protein